MVAAATSRPGATPHGTDGLTWMLAVDSVTPRRWKFIKQRMAAFPGLAQVTQDGDDEGVLRLMRLPSPAEAAEIRRAAGVRQSQPARPLLEGVSPPPKQGVRPLPFVLTSGPGGRHANPSPPFLARV